MWKDFKEFAFKGNVLDLAVAVVIGAAFGKIVSSLVENIIMPIVGALTGGIDLTGLNQKIRGVDITYGVFLQSVLDFLIVAFVIFLFIRLLAKFKRKEEVVEEEEEETIDAQEALLTEIRDLLKEQNANK
ncbi:large conductance mechanosensitive channel protein MscL [Sporosarcina pasteurii]|uniref:Large-conductance mechanosensitive channel n=1 Tax=Sporosarcina pasteurii TaxID=1474 RepID=A0A380CKT9_SPOPA|nr:large conductance mechanosensitive channel protein MscL [Sporosarcina pasteurii]MDS9471917.1 large conductance mechanosensitive channel protein MscL [Sporosarcina pasteurii]QBQ06649.1 large conductance mechanosensitive channel protein MscL [Sporosarcina pasteurii]SUJ21946.1 Large-conductance mechanosensitive channel [Sporosarcina pasteurii]